MVEIAKALRSDLSVLILDEPTASLTEKETEQLFALVEQLKAKGVGIVYITHRMAEIRRIADRITVLRDGKHIGTVDVAEVSEEQLVEMMTGREIAQIYPDIPWQPGQVLLSAKGLSTADGLVRDATFSVQTGEVVGFAGLVGCGKSEAFVRVLALNASQREVSGSTGRMLRALRHVKCWKGGFSTTRAIARKRADDDAWRAGEYGTWCAGYLFIPGAFRADKPPA